MKMNISIAGVIFYFLMVTGVSAQDIHFSQYHFNRLAINPGLTGMFNGDKQASGMYRRQWFSVPVEYMTFSGSFDMKLNKIQTPKGFFSVGALFNYDQAGDSKLSLASLGINGSYTRVLTRSLFATGGISIGGGQRAYKGAKLKWDLQWDGEKYDPLLPSQEPVFEDNVFFLDINAGANIRLQGRDRTKIDLGIGAFHLNSPGISFYGYDNVDLPIRTAIHALGVLKLANRLDLYANGLLQNQGPYEETLAGGGLIIHISNRRAREVELHLGVATRFKDALIPMFALSYDGWKGGFSYDINNGSDFEIATDKKGGPEFFLTYTYKKLWPLEQTKVCSIF